MPMGLSAERVLDRLVTPDLGRSACRRSQSQTGTMSVKEGITAIARAVLAAARRLSYRFRPREPTGSAAPPPAPKYLLSESVPVPADPAEHARQFAADWADRFEVYAARRMRDVGVPERFIGVADPDHRIEWRAFFPHQSEGGGNIRDRGINLDSGVLNPDLMDVRSNPVVSSLSRWARLRDRIDAVIAHELEEAEGAIHAGAARRASDTRLDISEGALRIIRADAGREP
jgi:hypothetical protein